MGVVAFDLETRRIRRPVAAPRPVCIQWCDREPAHGLDAQIEKITEERAHAMLTSDHVLVGHNVKYDTQVLMSAYPDLIDLVFDAYSNDRVEDTLLNQKLIDIANGELDFRKSRGYDLGTVSRRYKIEGIDKDDPWRLRYGDLEHLPIDMWPKDAVEYAKRDATTAWIIYHKQKEICAAWTKEWGSPLLHEGPARARYDLALGLSQTWGVRTNKARTELVEKFTKREIERMHDELAKESRPLQVKRKRKAGDVFVTVEAPIVRGDGSKNTKVVKQIVAELFTNKGQDVPLTQPKKDKVTGELKGGGDVSTEKDTMVLAQALYSKDSEDPSEREGRRLGDLMITYAEYTTANNLLGRVEDMKKGFDLPLQPRYDSLLETGRTSSSKGSEESGRGKTEEGELEGIQIQNFPRGFTDKQKALWKELYPGQPIIGARECLEPREGNNFIICDYAGAELHALAQNHIWWFGKSSLADKLNAGVDVLLEFGCEAYGKGVKYADLPKGAKKLSPYDGWRQSAKPIVYGRPGGMGAKKIVITARKSYGVILDLAEAQRLIRAYSEYVPELQLQFDYVSGLLGGHSTCLIRQMGSGRWRGGATYAGANNSFFQGLTADGALAALYEVTRRCYKVTNSALYGFRVVAFVHDELVLEGPATKCSEAATELQHAMEKAMGVYTPDCLTPAEPIVSSIWSKDAKQVWENGKLIPWRV